MLQSIKRILSRAFTKSTKNRVKAAIWAGGVGFIFRHIVDRKGAFERHFKRAPDSIMLFPTNLCNALCSFCAYPTNTDKKQTMPNDIAFKAIDDFIAMGGKKTIDLTTNLGDPLVDPRLSDKLAYAKSLGVEHTRFFTNGILLDREGLIEKIAPHLDELRISLPGLDRKNYLDVFKVDKAEKVARGLLKLAEYKKRTGHPKKIYLELRINRPLETVMQDDGIVKLKPYIDAGIITVGHIKDTFENWGGAISEADMVGGMKLTKVKHEKTVPCGLLFLNPGILPDGHVRACSCWYVKTNYDKLTLENVADKPLSEILFGDQHRAIMKDWMAGDLPPPCGDCSNYEPVFFSLKEVIGMAEALAFRPILPTLRWR